MPQNTTSADFYIVKKAGDPAPPFILSIWWKVLGLYEGIREAIANSAGFFYKGLTSPLTPNPLLNNVQKTSRLVFWGFPFRHHHP